MYCKNCGGSLNQGSVVCTSCGVPAGVGKNFCPNCGTNVNEYAIVCVKCGCPLTGQPANLYQPQNVTIPTNGKAIAAFVLGLISIIGLSFVGIVGIVLAIMARKEINQRGDEGSGFAIAGLIMSIIGTVIFFLQICFILFFIILAANLGGLN